MEAAGDQAIKASEASLSSNKTHTAKADPIGLTLLVLTTLPKEIGFKGRTVQRCVSFRDNAW